MKLFLALVALLGLLSPPASAHEVRPAYLELQQTGPETYDVLWKVPGRGEDLRFGVYVRLPQSCIKVGELRTSVVNNAFTDRWTVQCKGGLTGGSIFIEGLSSKVIDVLVRLERPGGTIQVTRLTPSAPSFLVEATPSRIHLATTYVTLGIEH